MIAAILTSLLMSSETASSAHPVAREPGVVPEQQDQPIRPGDQWIKMQLQVDAKGRPIRCGTIASNVRDSETRFWMCHAMMSDWHTDPAPEQGKSVRYVVRTMVIRGRERAAIGSQGHDSH